MPHFLLVKLKSSGVIALRYLPQSKMRLSFKYPPPSSLLGALAFPLLYGDRVETVYNDGKPRSRLEEVKRFFRWIAVNVAAEPRIYGSLLRINRYYRGKVEYAVTSLPITVLYGDVGGETICAVFVFRDDAVQTSSFTFMDFERAAWGIVRLGSRESAVFVEDVVSGMSNIREQSEAVTRYSFILKEGRAVKGGFSIQHVVDWRVEASDYGFEAPRLAMAYPSGSVTVEGSLKVMEIQGEEVIVE